MPPPPPELPDDLLGEAFLRLPPDDPACLLRASLACKRWRRILADPSFHRRHRELHRMPSVMGFLCTAEGDPPYTSRFVPSIPGSGRPAARVLPGRLVLDCRHGRVLFLAPSPSLGAELSYDLFVWDPLTNEERCLPRPWPQPKDQIWNAAVLCAAAEGCDHRKCHRGPFRVALVWSRIRADPFSLVTFARVYSSEKDNWSEPISVQHPYAFLDGPTRPSTLVGDTLYFRCSFRYVLEYQLGAQSLSFIDELEIGHILLMSTEDGELGCVEVEEDESRLCLRLWSREAASGSDGVTQWARGRAIELEKLLPDGALPSPRPRSSFPSVSLLGFAEGTNVIFVGTCHSRAVYMVKFNSGMATKVLDGCTMVVPYMSFCIPVTDASSTTEGPRDDASSTTEGPGDNSSDA